MILVYAIGVAALINCAYYLLFSKISLTAKPIKSVNKTNPISLIVCAKNEADNLQNHIPRWLEQNYPNFELILINDASDDETSEIMHHFAEQDPRIQVVDVKSNEAFWGSKKYALTLGIKRAKNHHLIFTDADCYPASEEWLSEMASQFSNEKQIVLGYGAYEKRPGFLNKLIRFETLMTAVQYFSYAKVGMPYMGVGRNLGYTSKTFYDTNGFIKHIKVASGDDDLFVNEAATSKNTAICIDQSGFTYSIPKNSYKQWGRQKKRHLTTAKFYKPLHKFLLGLFYISNVAFWILGLAVLFTQFWKFGLAIILIRVALQYFVIGRAARKMKETDLLPFLPFYELFLIFTQMSIFISNSGEKSSQWK